MVAGSGTGGGLPATLAFTTTSGLSPVGLPSNILKGWEKSSAKSSPGAKDSDSPPKDESELVA